jgi:thioredoxin 1
MQLTELGETTLAPFMGESTIPTVLVFHSPGSKPSRLVLPLVEELAEDYAGLVRFGLINAQTAGPLLDAHGILSLPTFLFYRAGKPIDRFIGLLTRDKLEEKIEANLQRV